MANIEIAAMTGRQVVLNSNVIEQFHSGLRGGHLLRGDDGYEAARKIYNAMIDHRPAIIARCAGAADVIAAVNFARNNGLLVSVRGGGHNVSGNAVCDGGLMIDLSPMKSVRVDPQGKTVRAEAGVTWGEFDRETQAFGLATTGGLVSTTGIAGLTLGGGLGWLMGSYGLACDNLISVDVVTADGRLLTASKSRNEDLFWGLRGGGGNFGIATSFEFQLHPVEPMLGGILIHRLDNAAEVIKFYDEFTRTSPDELGTFVGFVTSPEGERVMAIFVSYNGAVEEGQRILKPLREFRPPLADMIGPMRGPHLDMVAWVIAALALLSLGVGTVRWGHRRLRPFRPALGFIQPNAVHSRRRVLLVGCLRIIGGGIVLLAVMFFATEVLVRVECLFYSRTLPDWVPAHWWSITDMLKACQINDKADFMVDLVGAVIVALGALAFALNWLLRGVRAVLGFVGRGSGRSTETELSLSSTLRGRVI